MIAHSYPVWYALPPTGAEHQLAYRLFHTENEDGTGLDIGLTGTLELFATVYTQTKEGSILTGTTRGQDVRVPTSVNVAKASIEGEAVASRLIIPHHQEVIQEIFSISKVAAENLVVQGGKDVSEWVEATLNGCKEAILERYDGYTLALDSISSMVLRRQDVSIDSLLELFPEKWTVARFLHKDLQPPKETLTAHNYIALSKSKVPHILMVKPEESTLGFTFDASVGFGLSLTGYYLYETTASREVSTYGILIPPNLPGMQLLLHYGQERNDATLVFHSGGIHYSYFWEVDDFNPSLLRISLLVPPPRVDWVFEASETPAFTAIFRPFPLPVYRAYRRGEDFTKLITEEDVKNLL